MRQSCLVLAVSIATFASIGLAQAAGPYKVLKTARVGGEGGWDYIYGDTAGRRLFRIRRSRSLSRHGFDFQIHAIRATRMPINELRATKLGTKFVHRHENFFLNF